MRRTSACLGLDIGSTTVKVVVVDGFQVVEQHYVRSQGEPARTVLNLLRDVFTRFDPQAVSAMGITGSGGKLLADALESPHANELVAQVRALERFHPEARTVIEMGGQDSKLLVLAPDEATGALTLVDFAMNNLCAAGTGSFLDQQAERLGISIEEFVELALRSESPAQVAGRCAVFAKSDMVHLAQNGTPLPDIINGLCYALARNFKGTIGRGKAFRKPVLFQGGVAFNKAMVKAFQEVLGVDELVVPQHHTIMGAIGAALIAREGAETAPYRFPGLAALEEMVASGQGGGARMAPLPRREASAANVPSVAVDGVRRVKAYVGVDVGSVTTKIALIDEANQVIARRYLRTASKPLEAARQALLEVREEVGEGVDVAAVGVTGSGRHLVGDFVGADVVANEITAQATAAMALDPRVDTIFEIGGQDSKYIRVERGTIVDFEMNKACAAGTGSFLEERAEKLGISIGEQFAPMALACETPSALGQRCTVFMEMDLVSHQQKGARKDELVAGLAYSTVLNYLNNVVQGRRLGENIFFQGGVASNAAVVAAFEGIVGRRVTVPPHHDVSGAIGAAILARRAADGRAGFQTKFKGFDLNDRQYQLSHFVCKACANVCEISRVDIRGERPLFYGARCDIFDSTLKQGKNDGLPDLFKEREEWLLESYRAYHGKARKGAMKIGIPRALVFYYDLMPFWAAFFWELSHEVVLSEYTNPLTVRASNEVASAETCLPIKAVHGHVLDLLKKEVDVVFVPSIIDMERPDAGFEQGYLCPYVQATPYILGAAMASPGVRFLTPPLHFMRGEEQLQGDLARLAGPLGRSTREVKKAVGGALEELHRFQGRLHARWMDVVSGLGDGRRAVVLVGRTYNTCDGGLNMGVPEKLRKLGVVPIPVDFLPEGEDGASSEFGHMYWRSGQRILSAARVVREHPNLHAVYFTNFGCGPDAFIITLFREALGGKPFVELEVDEHTGDAGIITRLEAFLESTGGLARALVATRG